MANAEHAPAMASPVRTDEQIVPRNRWVPIGKSNCYLNEEKSQRSPIFKIAVDILKQTNFFRAFTASSTIPAIYIQQFWDTIRFDSKAGSYKCQLDEQWFNLTQDTLRDALQITPVDNNRAFSSPPTPDTLVEFVNKLGYPKEVMHLSNVTTNDMFQPWRALATIINLCLTGKTSGFERPRAPVLQILWGIVNRAHIDYAERMWEEFTYPSTTFTEDKGSWQKLLWERRKGNRNPYSKYQMNSLMMGFLLAKPTRSTEEQYCKRGARERGKEKVGEEQAAQVLLNLQTPKKKSSAEQYIFQRRSHIPTKTAGHEDSTSLYAELGLYGNDKMIPEEPVSSTGTLSSLQHLAKDFSFGDQFLNDKPSEADNEKTTADTEAESMVSVTIQQDTSIIPPMTSPVIDLVSRPDSPNVHWPLPTTTTTTAAPTTTTTTTTLPLPPQPQQGSSDSILIKRMGELEQHIANLAEENQALETRLDKQGNRIHKLESVDVSKMIREQTVEFIDSQEIDRKINESVKEVVISSVKHAMRAPLRARFKDLPTSDMKEILLQRMLEENYDKGHAEHRVAYEALQGSIHRDECEDFDDDKAQEETKKKGKQDSPKPPPGSPPSPPPPPPPPSGASGASGTTRASDSAQAPPPPPPSSSTHQGDQSTGTAAPSSSKSAASAEYSAWTTTDTRIKPSITLIPDDLYMDDETTADEQAVSSDDEVGRDHIPTVNLRQSWWKPLTEDRPATPEPAWTIPSSDLSMPTHNWASALKSTYVPPQENSLLAQTGDMATFMDWYCKQQGISELTPKDLEGPAFEIVKVFHHDVIHLQFQMEECHKLLTDQVDDAILRYNVSKPLPLGGEPGHVTIQPDFFFNKDLEYLRYGRKVGRPALSISKMKAAYYPDVGLEQLVPDQFWIAEECKYDIAAMYGISHWWFQRQRFYIDRFSSEGDRRAVRTHMRILSVVRIEVFSMYGYNYMKKIVLRRADLKEYVHKQKGTSNTCTLIDEALDYRNTPKDQDVSSGIWKALLVDGFEKATTGY
ncbi:hypothetical protein Tco_0153184 [Tanacetum coccineum]